MDASPEVLESLEGAANIYDEWYNMITSCSGKPMVGQAMLILQHLASIY